MARAEKVAQNLKKEISSILHDELNDPRLGFITITRVELTADLQYARVFYSVLGGEEERLRTRQALDSALGFIRRLIGQRIRLRFTPELVFKEDHSSEYSIKIEEVLDQIRGLDESKKINRRHKKTK
ncbi:MAG: 30S ribosome-binding factor RbfA [Candidatus Omnitrophota bacterium]